MVSDTIELMKRVRVFLDKARNIYDILVCLYEMIDNERHPRTLREYYCEHEKGEYVNVNGLLDALLNDDISFKKFKTELLLLMERMQNDGINVHILRYFNQVFWDRERYSHLKFGECLKGVPLFEVGPLNSNQDKYRLYLMSKDNLIKKGKAYQQIGYRCIKRGDSSDIFSEIDSYKIIRSNANMYAVTIKNYQHHLPRNTEQERIRVAVFPLDRKKWFRVQYDKTAEKQGYFDILDEEDSIDKINQKYKSMIDRIYRENIDIAILPELSMNRRTEGEIKKYLAQKAVLQPDARLKLLFMGSVWDGGNNECILFSGNGSVLLRNRKRNPFSFNSEGKEYKENLTERPKKYELLDMDEFGRILYVICKDDLNDLPQISFWNEYEVGMEIISSFSPSVSYFVRQMKRLAEDYLGVSFLANSCEPRQNKEEIGCLVIPAMRKEPPMQTEGVEIPYTCSELCQKNCQFCGCIHTFELNLNQIFETDEKKHIKVSYKSDMSNPNGEEYFI